VPVYYTDADVDTHLNTGTATTGQILSWTGSDYDWIDNQVGDITAVEAGTYLLLLVVHLQLLIVLHQIQLVT
jgi:hypothetical protein